MADENVNVPVTPAVNVPASPDGNPVGSTGGTPMPGTDGDIAKAPASPVKLGSDGEPIPVGTNVQKMVAEAIAATFRGENPTTDDVNAKIRHIAQHGQIQSTPGLTPVELDEPPAVNVVNTKPAQVKAQGVVIEPPK